MYYKSNNEIILEAQSCHLIVIPRISMKTEKTNSILS